MSRNVRRFFAAEDGASLVEYSLAVVLIGLAAVVVTSFVGQSTSDAFDEIGNAFPAESVVAASDFEPSSDAFDELLERIEGIDSLGNSLSGKAEDAEGSYLNGDVGQAVARLNSLMAEVDAQQGKQLSFDDAVFVRNAAEALINTITAG
jgi:Flp pilus assembly pilin Flp